MRFRFEGARAATSKSVKGTIDARCADSARDELLRRGIVVDGLVEIAPSNARSRPFARARRAFDEDRVVVLPWKWRLGGAAVGTAMIVIAVVVLLAAGGRAAGLVGTIGAIVAVLGALVVFRSLVGRFGGGGPGNEAA